MSGTFTNLIYHFVFSTKNREPSIRHEMTKRLYEYIRNQAQHHRTQTFKVELVELLERHGVEYDSEYIWK